jgi:NAD(P)-dependent dehydrogenase (short-subunit alcohol dehydrogenase family)
MIILSGATGGIGKRIIPELLKLDSVIGLYNSGIPQEVSRVGRNEMTYLKLDLTSADAISRFQNDYADKLNKVTIVHLAAIKIDGLAVSLNLDDWNKTFKVNVHGAFQLTRAILPHMVKESWGRIIYASSSSVNFGDPGTVAYSASKAALTGISRTMAKEYGRFNITSNVLCLGYFEVGLIDKLPPKMKGALVERVPSKKLGNPVNISNAISFLMKSDYVNGSIINIDGAL